MHEPAVTAHRPWWRAVPWLLVLFWTVEIWVVQWTTTAPTLWNNPVMVVKDQVYRFLVDFGMVLAVVLLLPRWLLSVVFVVNVFFFASVISFEETYERALSLLTVMHQWKEGAGVAGGAMAMIWVWMVGLGATMSIKQLLMWRTMRADHRRVRAGVAVLAAWVGLVAVLQLDHKDMRRLRTYEQTAGIAHVYGYLVTWVAEFVFVDTEEVMDRALERLAMRSDQLGPVEVPVPVSDRVVLLQVESLDAAVMGFEIDGREVTPELNALRARSMYFHSQARKLTGSCDTDFTALMGRLPSDQIVAYRLPEMPWETSVVGAFDRAGYETGFFHGVSGTFFHRRDAFERMGFDVLRFKEEYVSERGADPEIWTVADGPVMDWASEWMQGPGKRFSMVITATSHLPFRFETPGMERTFFPGAQLPNRAYFDSIHYVDAMIGRFVRSLPAGTTVVIYGDHWSKMEDAELGYGHVVKEGFGLVPVMIHQVGADLHAAQRTRDASLALSGELTLLDVFTWVWGSYRERIAWSPDPVVPGVVPGRRAEASGDSPQRAQVVPVGGVPQRAQAAPSGARPVEPTSGVGTRRASGAL